MTKEITLTSLAMLKVKIDQGGDYLDYLLPFVMHILEKNKIDRITDSVISERLKDECGLVIPKRTIQIILKRLARQGYIQKENDIFKIKKGMPKDFTAQKEAATRSISSVLNGLRQFAHSNSRKEITEEQAVDSIIAFLSKFSMECLKYFLQGTALPKVDEENWQIFLVSQYVKNISENDSEKFNSFIVILKGHMLANALLCPDLQTVSQSYNRVTFFLDTPLLLQLLGLGQDNGQAINELISLVKNLKGSIACFSHTLDETVNAITKSSDFINSESGFGSIVMVARKTRKTKSDLILLAESAEEKLADLGLDVIDTPSYIHKFQIDETIFENILLDEVHYDHNPKAK